MRRMQFGMLLAVSTMACATAQQYETDWDADLDGYVDPQEFRASMEVTRVFDGWDNDDGGYLTREEFDVGLTSHGIRFNPALGYAGWDQDGDGRLAAEEFYVACFAEIDVDDNGLVDPFELRLFGPGLGLPQGIRFAQIPPR